MAASPVRLRRAEADDLDFLAELMTHEDVEPYLAASRSRDRVTARNVTGRLKPVLRGGQQLMCHEAWTGGWTSVRFSSVSSVRSEGSSVVYVIQVAG